MTISALPPDIMNIAGIGVAHTILHRDAARHCERRRWRALLVEHAVIRMERREMQRYIGTKAVYDPTGQILDLICGVVLARDQERGDFEPHVRLVL